MKEILLIAVLVAAGFFGRWIMGRVDRFLDDHTEEDADEPEDDNPD